MHTYLNWRAPVADATAGASEVSGASALLASLETNHLNERQSLDLFAALGIECARSVVVTDPAQRVDIDGPAAVKLLSADVPHKTDAGMVRLGVEPGRVADSGGGVAARGGPTISQRENRRRAGASAWSADWLKSSWVTGSIRK